MSKKYIRYFGGFIETEQRWLNAMSAKGYRLIKTGKLWYEFEKCEPDQYQYYVDFVGHKSNSELERYSKFLEDVGYRVISKNMNLNWSFGKVRYRPSGKGAGTIATSPGNYNKELLIIEKLHDDKPFILHTTIEDKITYYKPQRDAYSLVFLISFGLFIWNALVKNEWNILSTWLFLLAAVITFFPTLLYQKHIHQLKKEAELSE